MRRIEILLIVFSLRALAATEPALLESDSHCVAYKVQKTTLLVSSGTVIGKNCDVSAQVLPEVGGLYHIEVNIPIRSFQSGDADRDEHVGKTLKVEVRPELSFKSKALTSAQWHELFAKKDFTIAGDLTIGEKTFPLKLNSHYLDTAENAEVTGMANVRFSDFELEPPVVGGGLIAKTKPEFELYFHLLSSRILGADSIRLAKSANDEESKK